MKHAFWLILAAFLLTGSADAHKRHRDGGFGLFYSSLSPHGEWIEVSFGTAWRPYHTGHNWRPYTHGRWIWTDYGWYWSSYEPFGWATYHYGRWAYDDYYGWIWIPDDVWGPAWVEWRYNDDYIGWAPLPPHATWSFHVGITFGRRWVAPVHYWSYVPCANFSSVRIVNYVQPHDVSRRIHGRTRDGGTIRSVGTRVVNDAIRPDRIERRTGERIRRMDLVDRGAPGEDRIVRKETRDRLEVYRPGPDEVRRDAPARGDGRIAPRSDAGRDRPEMKRERPQVYRERPGVKRDRPEMDRARPEVKRERPEMNRAPRPEVKRERPEMNRAPRPEVKRERPEMNRAPRSDVKRERPEVKRERPDGGGRKPRGSGGRRGPDG